jgi:hypothetical protein
MAFFGALGQGHQVVPKDFRLAFLGDVLQGSQGTLAPRLLNL